ALLPWLPVKLLTNISLTHAQLTLFFSAIATCCFVWLLTYIPPQPSPTAPWGRLFAVIVACYGTGVHQALHYFGIYPVPIAGAYCFTAIALLLLWPKYLISAPLSTNRKLLASLCLGLAVGCRATHIFNCILLLAAWVGIIKHKQGWHAYRREALYLGAP